MYGEKTLMVEKHYYDVRTSLRIDCLPSTRTPDVFRHKEGHVVSVMSAQALKAAMQDHERWAVLGVNHG